MAFDNFSNNNQVPISSMGQNNPNIQINQGPSEDDIFYELVKNLNKKIKIDNTKFRDEELEKLIASLISQKKSNAVLIGDAGVGKTQIVESLAYKIENKDPIIPSFLYNYNVVELPISAIIQDTSFRGQLEKKLNFIINYAKNNKVILFIDEIHQILEDSSNKEIAQILKPELARGEIKIIAATTTSEAKILENDPAFKRRFQKINVNELTKDETLEILKAVRKSVLDFYDNKILITNKDLEWFLKYSEKYKNLNNHRPDTALTLMDRTCAKVIVKHYKKLNTITDKNVLNALKQMPYIMLGEVKIKEIAKYLISSSARKKEIDEDEFLNKFSYIKGQDKIIEKIIKRIKKDELNLFPSNRPLSFLFAGKSGVGKTEISNIIANYLTGEKPIKLNMTEYQDEMSISNILGSSEGFVGYNDNKERIFDKLKTNPYQVILLDEFDKAHPRVQKIFMQILDEGFLDTFNNSRLDFSKSIIIATNNSGFTKETKVKTIGFNQEEKSIKQDLIDSLRNTYPVELLNRFTEIYEFNSISKDIYEDILKEVYEREIKRIKDEHPNIKLNDKLDENTLKEISDETYSEDFNARPAYKAIKEYIENNV